MKQELDKLAIASKRTLALYLQEFISDARTEIITKVCKERTNFLQLGIEDIYMGHNTGALMRTCDCLGVQMVHVFGDYGKRPANLISRGSAQWLNVRHYDMSVDTKTHMQALQAKGLQLVVATPHNSSVTLDKFVLDKPSVLFFGNEAEGASDALLAQADVALTVPIYGFCESFNVSVCAAIVMHSLMQQLRLGDIDWRLSEGEQLDAKITAMMTSLGETADKIVARWLAINK